jgi:hypothetical protein
MKKPSFLRKLKSYYPDLINDPNITRLGVKIKDSTKIRENMMKSLFLAALFFCVLTVSFSQEIDSTEICIIGTSHTNTDFCNVQVLYSVLCTVKPDLILIELDSSFFNSDLQYDSIEYSYLFDEKQSSVEIIASHKYQQIFKTDIRPYDISKRNQFYRDNDFFNRQNQMYLDIYNLGNKDSLSSINQTYFQLFSLSLDRVNNLKITSLRELNSEEVMRLLEIQQFIELNIPLGIVETTNSLKKHIEFAHLQKDFWEKRNKQMVQNILIFAKRYKRIVVLTGNLHRYYLVNQLSAQKGNYKIKDFWKY